MKEHSKFYSSLGLLIILNVLIKPIWIFGIDRQVQNVVGAAAYGTYFSLFNLSIVFSFLLDWGLTTFFNRQLASQKENFIDRVGSFLVIKLAFLFIYIGVVFLIAALSGVTDWDILLNVVLIQAFTSLFLFFRGIITAHQWFNTDAWLSVIDKTLMIVLCGSFLYDHTFFGVITIHKFLLAQITCTVLAMFCALGILFRRKVAFSIGRGHLFDEKLFKSALPFAVIVLLMSVHYRLDGFLLERIHPNGAYEAGIYAGAYRLLDATNMIGYLFASFLLPYIAKQWSAGKEIQSVTLGTRHFLIMFAITVCTITFFLAPWIQQVLYHHDDMESIQVMQYCLPALIGYSLVQVYGSILTATGYVTAFCYITVVAVIINTVFNLILIPRYGALGCCIAALLSQGFCGLASMFYVKQKSGINFHFRSLLIYIFTAAIIAGFLYLSKDLPVSKWMLILVTGMITCLIMIITKLVSLRTWVNSLKKIT